MNLELHCSGGENIIQDFSKVAHDTTIGTIDALVCGSMDMCKDVVREIRRVCRDKFIFVSHSKSRDQLIYEAEEEKILVLSLVLSKFGY